MALGTNLADVSLRRDHVFRQRGRDRDDVVLFFGLFLLAVEPLARWQGQAEQGQHNGPERGDFHRDFRSLFVLSGSASDHGACLSGGIEKPKCQSGDARARPARTPKGTKSGEGRGPREVRERVPECEASRFLEPERADSVFIPQSSPGISINHAAQCPDASGERRTGTQVLKGELDKRDRGGYWQEKSCPITIRHLLRTNRQRAGTQGLGNVTSLTGIAAQGFRPIQQRRGTKRQDRAPPPSDWRAADRSKGCEARDLRDSSLSAETRDRNF